MLNKTKKRNGHTSESLMDQDQGWCARENLEEEEIIKTCSVFSYQPTNIQAKLKVILNTKQVFYLPALCNEIA